MLLLLGLCEKKYFSHNPNNTSKSPPLSVSSQTTNPIKAYELE
jgi:hypothetical protein